ncbi:MAG: GTP-binding protein [Thermoprotei archaeon]|nr:MAG: GTP-binding protein [Thermoprotei archaeon]
MPTNLPPEARAKWAKTLEARTPEEKLRALQEFLSSIPEHKGTSKLRAHVKHQIAVLRRLIAEQKARKRGGGPTFSIEKEGAAQVVLLGFTNSGRSSLLRSLTNAKPEVSDKPFTTERPVPGMMRYEDLQFQIVEAPALRGLERDSQTLSLARNADALIIVVDLAEDPVAQLSAIVGELKDAGIMVLRPRATVEVERQSSGGIKVVVIGRLIDCSEQDVAKLIASYGLRHALVKVMGEASLDDVEDYLLRRPVYKPTLIVANKIDLPGALDKLKKLQEAVAGKLTVIPASAKSGVDVNRLGRSLFQALDIIRVYTKEPGAPPSKEPLVVKRGSTVLDVAEKLHSRLSRNFKYAKVWSNRLPFSPQRVGPSFVLEDGDIVEIKA